jgi:cyclase
VTSAHFGLEQLRWGVYAAVAIEGRGAVANAGIVDLGRETLVFDTFQTVQSARELAQTAENETGRPVGIACNSHWHRDHVRGNQVFDAATIIASATTRELIATRAAATIAELRERDPHPHLQRLSSALAAEKHAARRHELAAQLSTARLTAEERHELVVRVPDRAFDDRLVLGADGYAIMIDLGAGHTASDAILHLLDHRLAFVGDLIAVNVHPWLGHGDPARWLRLLDELADLDLETIVPGHGSVAGPESIAPMRGYIEEVLALAAGEGPTAAVPEPYAEWSGGELFGRNVAAIRAAT